MSIEDQRGTERRALKWPRPALARRQPESEPLYTYVLDADTDLAEEFDLRSRVAARQLATARVLHAPVGDCDLAPWFDAVGQGPGLLILDGVVAFQTRVGDRTALEAEAKRRLAQMIPDGVKAAQCEYVIRNDGTLDELQARVDEVWKALTAVRAS